ncbi:MAG: hypothetical protein LBB76_08015 [Azoarcus sp.]|nr:hypothetical protein [Azoarcus sp.]
MAGIGDGEAGNGLTRSSMRTFTHQIPTPRLVRRISELHTRNLEWTFCKRSVPDGPGLSFAERLLQQAPSLVPNKTELCEKLVSVAPNWHNWKPERITAPIIINRTGSIWLYFEGCTDGTHAPSGYREEERYVLCYRGFVAFLDFGEVRKGDLSYVPQAYAGWTTRIFELQTARINFNGEQYRISREDLLRTVDDPKDYLNCLERALCEYYNGNSSYGRLVI